ncbi:hypothetical protein LCGC14_1447540 [marine sediment metagenome]|uniref:Uncharacterized protein n=1 Tax=marine sediment metagenome TaxID=412755 RepID=A0A0F9JJK6_9ZZZZ
MLDRVAMVIYDRMEYDGVGSKPVWVEGGNSLKQDEARRTARKAIEAMREPIKAMVDASWQKAGETTPDDKGIRQAIRIAWHSMIDAALK